MCPMYRKFEHTVMNANDNITNYETRQFPNMESEVRKPSIASEIHNSLTIPVISSLPLETDSKELDMDSSNIYNIQNQNELELLNLNHETPHSKDKVEFKNPN